MEKEGERRREEEKRQVQRATQQQQQPPQQHQKCPRCDSMNTKFCYFNNYSLSQPRHFCKSCKRYWTHGGTFRNIPVGGGSRKVKRAKTNSSSSPSSSSSNLLTTQPQQNLSRPSPPLTTTMVQSTSPYYNHVGVGVGVGSGYLSSLSPFHSLNTSSQPFNRYLKVGGGDVTASSNSSPLVSGFNAASSLPPRHHHQSMLYPAQQQQQQQQQRLNIIQSNMASTASSVSHSAGLGPQSLINNVSTSANHRAASDASLWSAATISGNSDHVQNNVKGGSTSSSSFIPNHNWLHRPGFGPPQ